MAHNYKKDKSRGLTSANYAQKLHKILRCVYATFFHNINIDGIIDGDQLEIRDINGRILHNATLSKGQQISIEYLSSGMYFIKLIRNTETVFIDKLSKL